MAASKNQDREAREARDRLKRYNARQAVHSHQVKRRRRDNIIAVVGVVVIAALAAATQIFYFSAGPGKPTAAPSSSPSASASATPTPTPASTAFVGDVPPASLSANRTWTGQLTLNTTKLGISVDGKAAPQAAASFINDIQTKYYQGKICHRLVVSSSAGLLQCGSEDGTGSDTGYSYGPIENAPSDQIYKAGTIAMARIGGNAYSNGHQFFIFFKDTQLPNDAAGGYTVVGSVTSGLADLEKNITDAGETPTSADDPSDGKPNTPTEITSASIK